jgi:hypothetical protein
MKKLNLNENFISRIWENPDYYSELKTTNEEAVKVLSTGKKNYDAGPDYLDAKIKLNDVIFTGSIEIHRTMADWFQHKHKRDDKYNDLILQVVMWDDEIKNKIPLQPKVRRARYIPTVILSKFLTRSIHEIWREVIDNPSEKFKLPCFPENLNINTTVKLDWINELSRKRLKYKSGRMKQRLIELGKINKKYNWEKMIFEYICEALGYSKNKEQFLKLSQKIDIDKIKKLNPGRKELDAILFGLAGFLFDLRFKNEYIDELKFRWIELKDFLREEIANKSEWNFFRLRPPNFPTLRIAYSSGLLFEIIYKDLFKKIFEIFKSNIDPIYKAEKLFKDIPVSDYWNLHYNFGKEKRSLQNIIGTERVRDIIVNVIIPVVILYAEIFNDKSLEENTNEIFKKMNRKKSSNEISRIMETQLGLNIKKVYEEQGLIQLHNFYCIKGRCRICRIGKINFGDEMVKEPLKIILY